MCGLGFRVWGLGFGVGVQILSRKMTKAPILLGEPGVGKTAVIEGLAQRIVEVNPKPKLNPKP